MANNKQNFSTEESWENAIVPEHEWPFEAKNNWTWTRLGKLVTIKTGKEDANFATTNGSYLFYTCAEQPLLCDLPNFSGESILIAGNGMFHVNYYVGDFNAYQRTYVLQNFKGVSGKYLYFHLKNSIEEITKSNRGSTIQYIRLGDITNNPVPLPPLAEQQRIVDIIENLFDKLDQAKRLIDDVLDSFESRKTAILHKAFCGELTKKWREENGDGLENWEEKKLKEVCRITSGGTPSRTKQEFYSGDIPWIKTGEIIWNNISDSGEKITLEAISNSSAKIVPKGSVLLAMYGQGLTRGRAAILDIEATTNQAVCVLIPKMNLYNKFLYYYFMYNYWKLRDQAVGGNQPNYSGKIIGDFTINLPQLCEQKEIVRILDNILELEEKAKKLFDLTDSLDLIKKSILGSAFRGELGTNNQNEENSIELLKKVL